MRTIILINILLITAFTSCKKKNKVTEEPTTPVPYTSTTDTVISFRIGLYPPAPGRKVWSNPTTIVVAGNYKSEAIIISSPTFSYNGSAPCNQYNWNGVGSYNLRFKKGTIDTIILRNYEAGTGNINLEGKYVFDLTVSPPKLNYAGTSDHLVICDRSTNSISFGDY